MTTITTQTSHTHMLACPICHQTASLKRVASLYETARYRGNARFAPPTAPRERSFLTQPITWGVVIETITLLAVMVICASNSFSMIAYFLAVLGICLPLVLSAVAFRRMLIHEKRQMPVMRAWEESMITWNQLRYCPTDDCIFDPTALTPPTSAATDVCIAVEPAQELLLAPAA
ncbi:MAG: hypothetical protein NVSMB27_42130 [Ktedonobacteraceae bacterium]